MTSRSVTSPWRPQERKRDAKFEEKRRAVLEAGASLFRKRGYDATHLAELADMLHVTKPTIYYYFESKDHLLLEIKRLVQNEVIDFLKEIEASDQSGYEKIRAAMIRYARTMESDFGACFVLDAGRGMEAASEAEVHARVREGNRIVARILEAGQKDGSLVIEDPVIACLTLFGSLNWTTRWYDPNGRFSAEQLAEIQVNMLLHGISAAQPARAARSEKTGDKSLKAPRRKSSTPRRARAGST